MRKISVLMLSLLWLTGAFTFAQSQKEFKIPYQQYKLTNGLDVILHVDASDPLVTVYICYHVGSNREKKGKTGFAHLFEHIMFQESQHIPQDQFFKKIQGAGGTLNGSTSNDRTNYFETLPKNALEMALWMEADRMGYLLSTLTQDAFLNQQNVVMNEKRQGDNRPYSQGRAVLGKLLYPEDHPYNWTVIGEMEDLANASLQDVIDFHKTYYGPQNATLVVAGDINVQQTRDWIERYFGEIKGGEEAKPLPKMNVKLSESKRATIEDKLASAPDLILAFPTVEQYNPDAYALRYLGQLLSASKKSPLYKVIVEEKKLAPQVNAFAYSQELTGTLTINVRAFPGKKLAEVEEAIREGLNRFEKEGFSDLDLARLKNSVEIGFYNSIASTMGKAMRLAEYNEYAGSTDFMSQDLNNSLNVSKEDVWRVYKRYIKDQPSVLLGTVPTGKIDLAAPNAPVFPLKEESLAQQGVSKTQGESVKIERIPTAFDRSIEPPKGPDPVVNPPPIWTEKMTNGIEIYGVRHSELPLVQFALVVKGGMLLDPIEKVGTAALVSRMLSEGTEKKTPVELREAMQDLGANISIAADSEAITLTASCLAGKLPEVIDLAREMILEPRWDEKEFPLAKQQTLEGLNRLEGNPAAIAGKVFSRLIYGADCLAAYSAAGTIHSVEKIGLEDLKTYYTKNISPSITRIAIAGDVDQKKAVELFATFSTWPAKAVEIPSISPSSSTRPGVYFVDIPKAQQSQFRVGHLALPQNHPDFTRAQIMNHRLGGDFNGLVNMILREEKGFTYGARTTFTSSSYPGTFNASTSVQTNATLETAQIFRDTIATYREGISEDDLNGVKSTLLKGNALKYETLGALIRMITPVAVNGYPRDYIKKNEAILQAFSPAEHRSISQKYLDPSKMIYLIVGDRETQFDKLMELGLGEPVLLDKEGKPLSK